MNKIIKAKIKLMKEQPFFGRLVLMLDLKEDKNAITAGTDGEYLYYNPDFINSLTDKQLMGILCHEVLHAALGHIWRRDKRERHYWNLACDYAINPMVQHNGFELPQGVLIDSKFYNMNSESIYDRLPKTSRCANCSMPLPQEQEEKDGKDKKGKGSGEGKEEGKNGQGKGKGKGKDKQTKGSGGGQGEGEGQGKDNPYGEGKPTNHGKHICNSHQYWKKAEKTKNQEQVKERWEGAVAEAATRDRGTVPAGFERLIEEMTPREDWKRILSNFLSISSSDFDFFRRDRRTLDTPFYIPDLASEEKLEDVVVALDTSGSIGPTELNHFVSEVKKILQVFPGSKGWLIECDAAVGDFMELSKVKEKKSFSGGGGTSHRPVFTEINKRKLKPKVLIAFTDMYTDFPDRTPDYPVLWLVCPGGDDRKPPFGRVVKMKEWEN